MPSLAVDRAGNMAIGYSTSSSAPPSPQIKYAGRLAGDPVNTLQPDRADAVSRAPARRSATAARHCTRWGDYSAMTLDPDGCTFWYTNEYYVSRRPERPHAHRLVPLPGLHAGRERHALGHGHRRRAADQPARPSRLGSRTATTNGSGAYSFTVPAGTYPTLTRPRPGFDLASASTLVVTDGGTTTKNFALSAVGARAAASPTTRRARSSAAFRERVRPDGEPRQREAQARTPHQPIKRTRPSRPAASPSTTPPGRGRRSRRRATGQVTRVDVESFCSGCSGTTARTSRCDPGDHRAPRPCRPAPTSPPRPSPDSTTAASAASRRSRRDPRLADRRHALRGLFRLNAAFAS